MEFWEEGWLVLYDCSKVSKDDPPPCNSGIIRT